MTGYNFLNWYLTLRSFHYSLYVRCVYCPGDLHWARLEASTLGSLCCLPRMEEKRRQLSGGATISATNHIGHSKTISATAKNHIGHMENQYRPQPYRPQNIRRVYLASSGRYFSVSCIDPVRIVNLNVKPRIRPIGRKEAYRPTSPLLCRR